MASVTPRGDHGWLILLDQRSPALNERFCFQRERDQANSPQPYRPPVPPRAAAPVADPSARVGRGMHVAIARTAATRVEPNRRGSAPGAPASCAELDDSRNRIPS
jgi:hypothetical protein